MRKNRHKGNKSTRTIKKEAGKNTTSAQRSSKKALSTAAIQQVEQVIRLLKPCDLSARNRLKTYQAMLQDDAVAAAINDRITAIQIAQSSGRFKYNPNSPESVKLKEFLEYNMKSLNGQTPRSVGRCAAEMLINGWAPFENLYRRDDKEYEGLFVIDKLAYIHPLSVDPIKPYVISDDGNKITKLRQLATAFRGTEGNYTGTKKDWTGVKEIDFRRITYTSYSATSSQPMGTSPLDAAYISWKEKQFLQDNLMVGITRDFSGVPVLRIPSETIEAAENDPTGVQAQQVASLTAAMHLMHSGDATYIILPSDAQSENGTGLRDFDFELRGIEGSGKNFNIVEIIESKRKAIFNTLAASHLISGENGGGSYNLREGQATTAAMHVGLDCEIIDEMWNKEVFPRLLELNGWEYKLADLPYWESGSVQPLSIAEFSKGLQRFQNFIPQTPEFLNEAYAGLGLDARIDTTLTVEEVRKLLPTYENNTGKGDGTSGTGSTQAEGKGSAVNSENAA